jgi:hypothetical protein
VSAFLTELCLVEADGQDDGKWIVGRDLVYQSDVAKAKITVPAGFKTDLASVPRLPVVYWLAGGTSSKAAVIHDYLYTTGQVRRDMADAVLREASACIGVPAWRRWIMWAGVRLGGSSHYAPTQQDEAA